MAPANVFAFVTFGALRFEIRGDGRTMGFPRGKMGETGKAGSWLSERFIFVLPGSLGIYFLNIMIKS